MAEIRDVTDPSFAKEVLESELPLLVDFWGDNCPACRQIAPLLKDLAQEYDGRLRVVKLHAAENPQSANRNTTAALSRCRRIQDLSHPDLQVFLRQRDPSPFRFHCCPLHFSFQRALISS